MQTTTLRMILLLPVLAGLWTGCGSGGGGRDAPVERRGVELTNETPYTIVHLRYRLYDAEADGWTKWTEASYPEFISEPGGTATVWSCARLSAPNERPVWKYEPYTMMHLVIHADGPGLHPGEMYRYEHGGLLFGTYYLSMSVRSFEFEIVPIAP